MDGLVIGLDLCDAYTQVSCAGREDLWTIPTVICKKKGVDEWYVGEEAYGLTLDGQGIIVDKLIGQVQKGGSATIEGVRYEAISLLQMYLEKVLALPAREMGAPGLSVRQLVITLQSEENQLMDALMYCADYLKIPRKRVHLASHAECFSYYVLSQKKEVWSNLVGLFELSEERLCYYEMRIQRGTRKMTVKTDCEQMEAGFSLSVLDTPSGGKLADKILCSCGERVLQKKLFSAVFLTGKGFNGRDWAEEFMKLLCAKRRVYAEDGLFARGASYKAGDYLHEKTSYPFVFLCEGRLGATVSVPVLHKERESQLIMAAAGESWYECKSSVELIADGQDYVELSIAPPASREVRRVKIPLEGFPQRTDMTNRIQMQVCFLDEKTMAVSIRDRGFGELYPATDARVKQEVML